jgi:3-methylcrotonyl-CoA carboxylase alpha subunit
VSDPAAPIDVVPLGDGRFQVAQGTTRTIAYAVTGRDTWVFLDGRTFVIGDTADGSPRRSSIDEQGALTAPMPATVLKINVAAGQRVKRNDVVMVLEAMKMELPIRSPRDGVVKAIRCEAGELVQPGTMLLELEGERIAS